MKMSSFIFFYTYFYLRNAPPTSRQLYATHSNLLTRISFYSADGCVSVSVCVCFFSLVYVVVVAGIFSFLFLFPFYFSGAHTNSKMRKNDRNAPIVV